MDQGSVAPRPAGGTLLPFLAGCSLLLALGATGCTRWDGASTPPPAQASFTLSANPASLDVPAGGSGYAVVTVVRSNGFTGAVTLSVAGLPAGVVADGTIPASASTGYLTVAVDGSVTPQAWTSLALEGQSGALDSRAGFQLTVAAALPSLAYPVNLVEAGGGLESGGAWSNSSVLMEPVAQTLATSTSGSIDNQSGFLPDADPCQP